MNEATTYQDHDEALRAAGILTSEEIDALEQYEAETYAEAGMTAMSLGYGSADAARAAWHAVQDSRGY